MRRSRRLLAIVISTLAMLIPLFLQGAPKAVAAGAVTDVALSPVSGQSVTVNGQAQQVLWQLPQRSVTFTMAAVSWASASGKPVVQWRLQRGGAWSDWQTVDYEVGPGAGRKGTDPTFVGTASGIEIRLLGAPGTAVTDPRSTLIDSDTLPAAPANGPTTVAAGPAGTAPKTTAGAAGAGAATGTGAAATPPASGPTTNQPQTGTVYANPGQPTIVTRAGWGADESLVGYGSAGGRSCLASDPTLQGAIIHHTADDPDYTPAQAPGIVRSIYYYHAVTLQWCDIGYNFLVDKYGTIYEGRTNSMTEAAHGAHAYWGNWESVGVSYMGNTDQEAPTAAGLESMARVVAWRFAVYQVNPYGTASYWNGDTGSYMNVGTIAGHREVYNTACPGAGLWAQMGWLRSRVAQLMPATSLTLDALPGNLAAGQSYTLSGSTSPAQPGATIYFDYVFPDGSFHGAGEAPTAVVGADGRFSVTTSFAATQAVPTQIRAAMSVNGPWVRTGYERIERPGALKINSVASTITWGQQLTVSGTVSPAVGGVTVNVIGNKGTSLASPAVIGTVTTQPDGTWSLTTDWWRYTAGSYTVAAQAYYGTPLTTGSATFTRGTGSATLSPVTATPSTVFGGSAVTLSGSISPALGGVPIILDGTDANGVYTGAFTSTTTKADGTWSVTTNFASAVAGKETVRAAANLDGTWVRSPDSSFARTASLTLNPVPATFPTGSVTLSGQVSPAKAGVPIVIDGIGDGAYVGQQAATTTQADGTWSVTFRPAKGAWQFRAAESDGWWVRTDYQSTQVPYSITLNPVGTQPGGAAITYGGVTDPSLAGGTVILDGMIGTTYNGGFATATVQADGSWSVTSNWSAGQQAPLQVRAAICPPNGQWARSDWATFSRQNDLTMATLPTSVQAGSPITVSGTVTPASAGQTVVIDGTQNGTYLGQVGSTTVRADGTWSVTLNIAPGTWELRAASYNGWWARTAGQTVQHQYSLTIQPVAPTIAGGASVTYQGTASPSLAGRTVVLDGTDGLGRYTGGFASAVIQADGSWTVTSSWSAGVKGTQQVRAAVSPADADWVRTAPITYARDNTASVKAAATSVAGQPLVLTGTVGPARGGATVIVDIMLNDPVTGIYHGGVATVVTKADGTWTATITDAAVTSGAVVYARAAVYDGWWGRSDYVRVR